MEQDTTSQVEGRAPSVVPGAVVPAPMNPADPGSTGLFTMPSSQPAPSAVPAPQPAAPAQPERREPTTAERIEQAILTTAPGTAVRRALDMIIAGHLGALICVGDTDAVLAAGNDGFPLNISFTANRLFELSKMDGAIVVDRDLTQILRANFHLNPDPSLPTSETGMRHRTAARMSLLTNALVISVSERRQVVNLYINGKSTSCSSATTRAIPPRSTPRAFARTCTARTRPTCARPSAWPRPSATMTCARTVSWCRWGCAL